MKKKENINLKSKDVKFEKCVTVFPTFPETLFMVPKSILWRAWCWSRDQRGGEKMFSHQRQTIEEREKESEERARSIDRKRLGKNEKLQTSRKIAKKRNYPHKPAWIIWRACSPGFKEPGQGIHNHMARQAYSVGQSISGRAYVYHVSLPAGFSLPSFHITEGNEAWENVERERIGFVWFPVLSLSLSLSFFLGLSLLAFFLEYSREKRRTWLPQQKKQKIKERGERGPKMWGEKERAIACVSAIQREIESERKGRAAAKSLRSN